MTFSMTPTSAPSVPNIGPRIFGEDCITYQETFFSTDQAKRMLQLLPNMYCVLPSQFFILCVRRYIHLFSHYYYRDCAKIQPQPVEKTVKTS